MDRGHCCSLASRGAWLPHSPVLSLQLPSLGPQGAILDVNAGLWWAEDLQVDSWQSWGPSPRALGMVRSQERAKASAVCSQDGSPR
jgi:hypothetical protein